jgi:RecA-family ATPase
MMTVSQILCYEDNPDDVLLSNGYLEKGSPCVLCGPPGIGKSRLALQLAVKSILGQGFLGWQTRAAGLKWAFLQNENGLRRLKADLWVMTKDMTIPEMETLEKYLLIHAILNDTDGHLDLGDLVARKRVAEAVQDWKPDIVVGDPLTAFGTGDLNSDQDMLRTARDFGRVVREGDPRRIPFLVHHARTGKEAKAGVAGADRSSYARNSKALYGWTRAQFNMAPVNKDNNDRLLFASGKCNNAPEFAKFIIELDPAIMFYAQDG